MSGSLRLKWGATIIEVLKKKALYGACVLGVLAVLGWGIGYQKKCPDGLYVTSNATVALLAWLAGAEMCR